MKFKNYLKDLILSIAVFIFSCFIIMMLFFAFKVPSSLIIAILIILILFGVSLVCINFFRKRKFYNILSTNVNRLDKKFLVLETIPKPNFYEGEILYQNLYDINKSMLENINQLSKSIDDFKEYVEMWIHEVKIPISSLVLMSHNHKDSIDKSYIYQIKKLDNYIDQILYYVRSNYLEQDFLIKKVPLDKVIHQVALKNKDDLLENKIDLNVDLNNLSVLTDSKWLEFILNQIINNSIKYKKDKETAFIKITAIDFKDKIVLTIYDNGIGILKSDINNVFKKSFTGQNGRIKSKATGMGLYIASKLCTKLGHRISIKSEYGKYTEVMIEFGKNDFYNTDN